MACDSHSLDFYLKLKLLFFLLLLGSLHWRNGRVGAWSLYFPTQDFYSLLLLPRLLWHHRRQGGISDKKVLLYQHQGHFALVSSVLCRDLKLFFVVLSLNVQKQKKTSFDQDSDVDIFPSDFTSEPPSLPRTGRARKEVKYFAESDEEEDVDFAMFN